MTEKRPIIDVRDLVAAYGDRVVLDGVSMRVLPGEVRVILGPSGCGKTTLLKHIIGLLEPRAGSISLLGREIVGLPEDQLSTVLTDVGMLFQGGALIQSMTLFQNVMVPLEEHTDLDRDSAARVAGIKLAIVGLGRFLDLKPAEISGGMRKRAALARALALDPAVLFCDEPTAGLDPVTAAGIDRLLLDLRDALGITIVVISHELVSIRRIADQITMLHTGVVIADSPLAELEAADDPRISSFFAGEPPADVGVAASAVEELFVD